MPAYVFKNSKKDIAPWVVDIPAHQVDDFAANWADQGWKLDTKADPLAVARETAAPSGPVETAK